MRKILILLLILIPITIYGQADYSQKPDLGILEFKTKTNKEKVVLYNQDKSEWIHFSFDYEENMSKNRNVSIEEIKKTFSWDKSFYPYFFKMDYSLLMFKCTGVDNDYYRVIVNSNTGLEKFVKKDPSWVLKDWPTHIKSSVVTIDFDYHINPVKLSCDESSATQKIEDILDPIVQPIEVRGDWVRIKYTEGDASKYGWIKWKKKNKIIVTFSYLI